MGSVSNFDDIPIRLLNQFYISDLCKHSAKMGRMKDARLGQIGTMAALGHLGHLGGVLVGRVRDIGAINRFTSSHFGGLGEIPISVLDKLTGGGKLGILDHLTIGQLLKLAKIGMLRRMTLGHITHIIKMSSTLRTDVINVAESATFKKGAKDGKLSGGGPVDSDKHKRVNEGELPAFAFHMPKVDQVYDMISLIHILQTSLIDLQRDYSKEMGVKIEISSKPPIDPKKISTHPRDIDRTLMNLKFNINSIVILIVELLEKNDDGCEMLLLEEENISDIRSIQIEDLGFLLTAMARTHYQGFVDKESSLKKQSRVSMFVLNRVMLGTVGSIKHLLGGNLDKLMIRFTAELCSKKEIILDSLKKDNDALDVDIKDEENNGRRGYVFNKKTKDPAGPAGASDGGNLVVDLGTDIGTDPDEPRFNKTSDKPSHSKGTMPLPTALYLCERLLGAPFNPAARNSLWKKFSTPHKLRAKTKDNAKLSDLIGKDDHCKAIAAGEDGGALGEDTHLKLTKIMAAELLEDLNAVEEELPWMDTPRKLRIIRILLGYGAASMKTVKDGLDDIQHDLASTTDKIVSGVEDMMSNSPMSFALSLGGITDPTILSIGSSLSDMTGGGGKTVENLVKPLAKIFGIF